MKPKPSRRTFLQAGLMLPAAELVSARSREEVFQAPGKEISKGVGQSPDTQGSRVKTQGSEDKITVINPAGRLPSLAYSPMAPRLDSLKGKTIYLVSLTWPYTHQFMEELQKALSSRFPESTFILKKKNGGYAEDDPRLWSEIQENGNAAIVGIGH